MIWQLLYFLIVPLGAYLAGLKLAFWYHFHPPTDSGVDVFDIIYGAVGVVVYLLIVYCVMVAFFWLMHLDYGSMVHNALCPLCAAPPLVSPQ